MAARWQQWMPFHIDRFRGSPDVQAMHPAARCGLLYLLAAAWQTDDCSLSSDPIELATASGLGDELWAIYGVRILRKFQARDGRLVNAVLLAEWTEAKAVYDKRRAGAVRTNESRSPNAERTQSERNTDTGTVTGTETTTAKKQKPSRGKREADPRHAEFRALTATYWASRNPIPMPWDGGEAKQLSALLSANPLMDADTFRELLRRRYASTVNHADRPRAWLAKVTDYAAGPLNEFNKPILVKRGDANGGSVSPAAERQQRSNDAIKTALRNLTCVDGAADGSNKGGLPESGTHAGDIDHVPGSVVRDGFGVRSIEVRPSFAEPLQGEPVLSSACSY